MDNDAKAPDPAAPTPAGRTGRAAFRRRVKNRQADIEHQIQVTRAQIDATSERIEARTGRNLVMAILIGVGLGLLLVLSLAFIKELFMVFAGLLITPYDKGALRDIEQAIRDTPNLGANVGNDGNVIRASLPELTQDRRRDFVKIVRAKGEDAKVVVRNIRRKAKDELDDLKSEVGDDEVARAEKELEAITRGHVDMIDETLKRKEAELLEI